MCVKCTLSAIPRHTLFCSHTGRKVYSKPDYYGRYCQCYVFCILLYMCKTFPNEGTVYLLIFRPSNCSSSRQTARFSSNSLMNFVVFQFHVFLPIRRHWIAFYSDDIVCSSLSHSRWTKSCTGMCCDCLVCLTVLLVFVRILHLAMSVGRMMIWNLTISAAILRALQLVNSSELKAAICISPKKMPSCDFYSFVIFFYLLARFS